MFKKLWMPIFIGFLALNFVGTMFIEYRINKNLSEQSEMVKLLVSMELKNKEDNEKFMANMYKGMGLIMQGQSQLVVNQNDLNMGILRVHHFAEPHADKFYKNCPECQVEKQEIEQDSITHNEEIFYNPE
tara:strand:- start:1625 stop:2014 length:390 start_codon:yes stop_codon:yes gene_type:complete